MKGTKNNIWKVFAINLGKSILGICILIAVGFGSYKISYHFLSKNATNVNTRIRIVLRRSLRRRRQRIFLKT